MENDHGRIALDHNMNQLLPLSHPIAPPVTDVFIFIFFLQIATCVQMTYVVEIVLSFIPVFMQLIFLLHPRFRLL